MSGIICSIAGATYSAAGRTAKTVTANGNAQVDTAQSKFGGASALFDGNGDYLNSATGFSFAGDFTVEFFVRFASVGANSRGLATDRPPTSAGYTTSNWYIEKNTSDGLFAGISGFGDIITSTSLVTTNTWYHIAFVRSGTTVSLYLDGTSRGTPLTCGTSVGDGDISFGAIVGLYLNGHMDEIRVSNSARYTTTFTPTTTPFVNDANTLLLLHCNGTDATTVFTDDVGTNLIPRTPNTVTAVGNAQVDTAQSKFGGASALFDGTSDAISAAGSGFDWGTGNFTVEAWVRHTAINDQQVYWDFRTSGSNHHIFYIRSDNKLEYYDGTTYTSTTTLAAGTFYHLSVSRSSGTLKIFINGTQEISVSNSNNHSSIGPMIIGCSQEIFATNSVNGHMDEIRVSNTARYTANFTPSATPFVNDVNTLLLLHCDGDDAGTTFVDDVGTNEMPRTPKTVTANGNAQVSTAQSKFGGASALFDGTNDGLSVDNSDFAFGTGDFTYECFVRVADTNAFMLFDGTTPTGSNNAVSVWAQSGQLYVYSGGWTYQGVGTINNNTFYHVAVSRSSSNIRAFIDGTQVGSTTAFSTNFTQNILHMGKARVDAGYDGNGHMDEIRVSNTARYTANFTAPTAAFTNDRNTVLLIHCNGTNTQTTFFDDNTWANTVGNTYFTPPSVELTSDGSTIALWHLNSALTDSGPSALTLSTSGGFNTTIKKFGTASGDLSDSTTDFFARATTGHYWIYGGTAATGARQYTIEFWTYNTVFTNNSETDGGGNQLPLTFITAAAAVGLTTTGKMTQNQFPSPRGNAVGVDVGADSAPTSQWVHQAYVIGNDMKWRGYMDGKLQFIQTAIDPSSIYTIATDIQIGRNSSSGTNANLMIDEIRLSSTKRYGS